jgi:hypothetical protein
VNAGARPLPSTADPVNAAFWAACREHRIELQRCTGCRALRWPPARVCPRCLGAAAEIAAMSGRGTVWSHARYERALHPGFAEAIPYVVLAVELEEGPLMIAALHGSEDGLRVGAAVEVVFTAVTPEVTLPEFELRAAGSAARAHVPSPRPTRSPVLRRPPGAPG